MKKKPNFSRYRQGETLQYLRNLLDILTDTEATALKVGDKRLVLNNVVQELYDKWQPERRSEITAEIAALDAERDNVFRAFKAMVDAWVYGHYDADARAAAEVISYNINSHGYRIHTMSYEQQTSTLNAILNDCQGIHTALITVLDVHDWVEELRTLNDDFAAKYMDRIDDYFTVEPGVVARLIGESVAAYEDLSRRFEARWEIAVADDDPSIPQYEFIGGKWDILTGEFNTVVNRRDGRTNDPDVPENHEGEDLPPPGQEEDPVE